MDYEYIMYTDGIREDALNRFDTSGMNAFDCWQIFAARRVEVLEESVWDLCD